MTFFRSVFTCLTSKYFAASGRASRSEFWWFALFSTAVVIPIAAVFQTIECGAALSLVLALIVFALLPPYISVAIRRMHDTGKSGWWFGGLFIASRLIDRITEKYVVFYSTQFYAMMALLFVIYILMFYLLVQKGIIGANSYGDDPLEKRV